MKTILLICLATMGAVLCIALVCTAGTQAVTDVDSKSEREQTPLVYQRFAPSSVPDEPFQWLIPRREMLYLRHKDDYFNQFINARLEKVRTGNLFNANSRTFFGIPYSPYVGMIWANGTMSFEGVPGFGDRMFGRNAPCTISFQPGNPVNFKQYLEKNYLPFITTARGFQGSRGLVYRSTVGAVSFNNRLLYVVRLTALPTGVDPGTHVDLRTLRDHQFHWTLLISGSDFDLGSDGRLRSEAGAFGKTIGKFDKVGQQLRSDGTTRTLPEQWVVLAAGKPLTDDELDSLDGAAVKVLFEKQREYWDNYLAQGAQYDLPLSMLADAYRASLINMKIARRKIIHNGESYFLDVPGATMYKMFWWRDGGYILRAWDIAGHHNEARIGLRIATSPKLPDEVNRMSARVNVRIAYDKVVGQIGTIGRYQLEQREDGSYTAPPGQWDSTGIALWALTSHYLTTRDDKWLAEAQPYMERGAQFLMRARAGTTPFREWVQKYWPAFAAVEKYAAPLEAGLLPGGGGEGGARTDFRLFLRPDADTKELQHLARAAPKQSYFHDFFAVLALRSYAQVLRDSGTGDPTPYLNAAEDYVRALEVSIKKTQRKFDISWIPAGPDGDVKTAMIGAVLFPCRVFPPQHPLVTGTVNYFRGNAKLHIAPEGFYGTHPDRWSYTQSHLGVGYLTRGEYEHAQRLLDTFLRCMWLPGSWSENIQQPHSRTVLGDQPHIWATSLYVLMLREFLIREEGEQILIADGMHPLWLPRGKSLSVKKAPTDFGTTVDYTLKRSEDGKRINLDIAAKGPLPGEFVWTPRGFGRVLRAQLNGRDHSIRSGAARFTGSENHIEVWFQ